jgi:dUTP pyrophosphatase
MILIVDKSKKQLVDGVAQAISRSATMAELWERLRKLAARYGQPADILNPWLDEFLRKLSCEYGSEQKGWDFKARRDLALDPGEAVSETAMELLLEQKEDAVDEIVAALWGLQDKTADSEPALRIKKLYADARMPQRATEGASGLDLFAYIKGESGGVVVEEEPKLIGTGIAVEVPRGYDVQIRPRSGLSAKGVMVAFGTVDSDYRGEVMVTMYTLGRESSFEVKHGDKIAQLVVTKLADLPVKEAEGLSFTERGSQSHGSTGIT